MEEIAFYQFLKQHVSIISPVVACVGLLIAVFALLRLLRRDRIEDTMKLLKSEPRRAEMRKALHPPRAGAYAAALVRLNTWADDFYGKRLISWRAADRCLPQAR